MPYRKYVIWDSNVSQEDMDDVKEAWKEETGEYPSEEEIWRLCEERTQMWLEDEKANLNVPTGGKVLVIADLGLWDGRHTAYKTEDAAVLSDIIHSNVRGDSGCRFYCDGYDICCDETHHDGTNHYMYRLITNEAAAERLMEKLYMQQPVTRKEITSCTKSLAPLVRKVYG